MSKLQQRLKESLQLNNMSQNRLATELNLSQSVVNNYCTGKREPSLPVLISICKTLNLSADYLLGLKDYE